MESKKVREEGQKERIQANLKRRKQNLELCLYTNIIKVTIIKGEEKVLDAGTFKHMDTSNVTAQN